MLHKFQQMLFSMEPQKAKRHTSIQSLCYSGVKLDTFQEDLDGKNVALTDGLVSRLFALVSSIVFISPDSLKITSC